MMNYEKAHAITDEIIGFRRHIHKTPEIGFELPKTKEFVKEKLAEFGYENIREIGGGIVVTVGTGGKTFMLRADMDALPMKEESGLDFAATNGNSHSCGHDMHTAILLGAAKILKEMENELPGTIKLMFQPAEELLTGARSMVEAGVLENPKVDCAMNFHVNSFYPLGACIRKGAATASANNFIIKVRGKAAHGAMPEKGVDPVYIGAQIIIALQEMITREVSFTKSAVLTTGHFEAGTAANSIPNEAIIEGTMRTFDLDTQNHLKKRLPEIAQKIAEAYRGTAEVEYTCDVPVLINNDDVYNDVHRYIREMNNGEVSLTYLTSPATASEDFAVVANNIPSCMVTIGAADVGAEVKYPVHNPKVRFNEEALPLGTAILVECATKWLEEHK